MVKVDARTDQGGVSTWNSPDVVEGEEMRVWVAWLLDHFRALGKRGTQSRSIKIT